MVEAVLQAQTFPGQGLAGDHASRRRWESEGQHQVTLVQAELLPVIERLCGRETIDPAPRRPRNDTRKFVIRPMNSR